MNARTTRGKAARVRGRTLFRVAAGPRLGFGHLRRCVSLARALRERPIVALRGGPRARRVACALGCRLVKGPPLTALERERPAVLVVDDPTPSGSRAWCHAARRSGVGVASIRDDGIGAADANLIIDGRLAPARWRQARRHALTGARFAVLDPDLTRLRRVPRAHRAFRSRVVIALGGGRRATLAARLANQIAKMHREVDVRVAGGFVGGRPSTSSQRVTWLPMLHGLGQELSASTVAVLAGGVSLYEACALGVPTVALPVVSDQRPTIQAFAARGAIIAIDRGRSSATVVSAVARAVGSLLVDEVAQRRLARRARRLVDGRGARRVAHAVQALRRRADLPSARVVT